MGANRTIYVKVLMGHEEWIEVSAVTRFDAAQKALCTPGVLHILDTSFDRPSDDRGDNDFSYSDRVSYDEHKALDAEKP